MVRTLRSDQEALHATSESHGQLRLSCQRAQTLSISPFIIAEGTDAGGNP